MKFDGGVEPVVKLPWRDPALRPGQQLYAEDCVHDGQGARAVTGSIAASACMYASVVDTCIRPSSSPAKASVDI